MDHDENLENFSADSLEALSRWRKEHEERNGKPVPKIPNIWETAYWDYKTAKNQGLDRDIYYMTPLVISETVESDAEGRRFW